MKKIAYFLLLTLLCSCSNDSSESSSLEKVAIEQMEKSMKEFANTPSSVSFNNVKVVFGNDSICVLNFDMYDKDDEGTNLLYELEYVYYIEKTDSAEVAREMIRNLQDQESIIKLAKDACQEKGWEEGGQIDLMSDEERNAYFVFFFAKISSLIGGRDVN